MIGRLLLRLAVVNALTPQPSDPFPPTMAGRAVFDSRIDDLEFDQDQVDLPIILVYTEEDQSVLLDRGAGFGAFDRHINIRIEIGLGSFTKDVAAGKIRYGIPSTDSELEALLDLFEAQVYRTLTHPVRQASAALHKMVLQWDAFHSDVNRTVDGNNRLASRILHYRVRVCPEPGWLTTTSFPTPDTRVPNFSDAGYLNPLIQSLAQDPNNEGLIAMIREVASGNPQIHVPPLLRMSVRNDAISPADPNLLAILNKSIGPDTRIETISEWSF